MRVLVDGAVADVSPAVSQALIELAVQFDGLTVDACADPQGGAFVTVAPVDLGPAWRERESWLGFHISYLHPATDVYPHYVRADLARADGQPLGPGLTPIVWVHGNQPAIQVSRRSNRWDPILDTPARKAVKILDWLARQ